MSRILEPTSKEELLVDVPSRDDLSSLLDLAFGLAPGSHFLSDFPVWDLDLSVPDVRIFGNFEFGRLRAACGIRLVNLRVGFRGDQPHFSLKVAVLGAVCSHPEWRRKGLASELISEAVQWAKGQGAAAVFFVGFNGGVLSTVRISALRSTVASSSGELASGSSRRGLLSEQNSAGIDTRSF